MPNVLVSVTISTLLSPARGRRGWRCRGQARARGPARGCREAPGAASRPRAPAPGQCSYIDLILLNLAAAGGQGARVPRDGGQHQDPDQRRSEDLLPALAAAAGPGQPGGSQAGAGVGLRLQGQRPEQVSGFPFMTLLERL